MRFFTLLLSRHALRAGILTLMSLCFAGIAAPQAQAQFNWSTFFKQKPVEKEGESASPLADAEEDQAAPGINAVRPSEEMLRNPPVLTLAPLPPRRPAGMIPVAPAPKDPQEQKEAEDTPVEEVEKPAEADAPAPQQAKADPQAKPEPPPMLAPNMPVPPVSPVPRPVLSAEQQKQIEAQKQTEAAQRIQRELQEQVMEPSPSFDSPMLRNMQQYATLTMPSMPQPATPEEIEQEEAKTPEPMYVEKQTDYVNIACLSPDLMKIVRKAGEHFKGTPVITSGQRSSGRRGSYHRKCMAADFFVPGVERAVLAKYLRTLPEAGGVGTYCHTKSVHIDIGEPRNWSQCGFRFRFALR